MIARECGYVMSRYNVTNLEQRYASCYAESFGLVGHGYYASVVVAQYNDRFVAQLGTKDSFTRYKKVIAVNKACHGGALTACGGFS